jgi:Ni,Fe-hydrogenase maturation factor
MKSMLILGLGNLLPGDEGVGDILKKTVAYEI